MSKDQTNALAFLERLQGKKLRSPRTYRPTTDQGRRLAQHRRASNAAYERGEPITGHNYVPPRKIVDEHYHRPDTRYPWQTYRIPVRSNEIQSPAERRQDMKFREADRKAKVGHHASKLPGLSYENWEERRHQNDYIPGERRRIYHTPDADLGAFG